MMMTKPAAASGVSPVRMRSTPGRMRPIAPVTSHRPMNLRNGAGSGLTLASAASGSASLNPPAKRNRAASTPWMIHSATRVFLEGDGMGLSFRMSAEPAYPGSYSYVERALAESTPWEALLHPAGDIDADQAQRTPEHRDHAWDLTEDQPAHHDGHGRYEVGHRHHAARGAPRQRIRPRREPHRCGEHTQEDEPGDACRGRATELSHQAGRVRQTDQRADRTTGPGHL